MLVRNWWIWGGFFVETVMGELLMSETPGLGGLVAESYSMESCEKRLRFNRILLQFHAS